MINWRLDLKKIGKHPVGPGSYNLEHKKKNYNVNHNGNGNRIGFNSNVERNYDEQVVNDVPGPG